MHVVLDHCASSSGAMVHALPEADVQVLLDHNVPHAIPQSTVNGIASDRHVAGHGKQHCVPG
eukprot:12902749-Prorocentrum_lima.AAC.1